MAGKEEAIIEKTTNTRSNRYSREVGRDTAGGRGMKTREIRTGCLTNKVWKNVKLKEIQGVLAAKEPLSVWTESFPVRVRSVNILYLGNTLRERVEGFLPAK